MTVINHASHVTVACRQDIRITNTMLLNENIESSEVSDMHIALFAHVFVHMCKICINNKGYLLP